MIDYEAIGKLQYLLIGRIQSDREYASMMRASAGVLLLLLLRFVVRHLCFAFVLSSVRHKIYSIDSQI